MRKNVLLIGASGDIGRAIAMKLGKENYQLILHYHQNRGRIADIRNKLNPELILTEIQADLSVDGDIKNLLTHLVFPVDYIIFASGNAFSGLLQDTSEKTIDDMMSIHLKAPMLISKYLLPAMIKQKFGKIIFITSIWGEVGASNEVVYSTVKGAQNSFVKALAKEVGASGVSVNAVSPGFIDTKMNGHLSPEEREMLVADIPVQRAGQSREIAALVYFLMKREASYIHGEIIGINGGW